MNYILLCNHRKELNRPTHAQSSRNDYHSNPSYDLSQMPARCFMSLNIPRHTYPLYNPACTTMKRLLQPPVSQMWASFIDNRCGRGSLSWLRSPTFFTDTTSEKVRRREKKNRRQEKATFLLSPSDKLRQGCFGSR